MRSFLYLMVLAVGCGDGMSEEPVGSEEQAIQGGAVDKKDPAVGLVWIASGGFCTGTLIAPNVVLTAGHCVEEAVSAFYTGAGKIASGVATPIGMTEHRVIDQVAHPSYRSRNVCPNPTIDVGLLRLESAIGSVKPMSIATQPPSSGTVCRTVGYGMHNAGARVTVEQKRSATETVMEVDKSSVHVKRKSGIVDHGDSGGPLVCGGAIVGTTSCGDDGVYPQHKEAYSARVDGIGDWIQQTIDDWQS